MQNSLAWDGVKKWSRSRHATFGGGGGGEKIFLECNDFEMDELKEVLMLLACKGCFSLDDFNGFLCLERANFK